jgi:hypothetical protein
MVWTVRAFRTGKMVTGERLTGLVEETQLTYEDAFTKAIHDYRAWPRTQSGRLPRETGISSAATAFPLSTTPRDRRT